MQQFFETSHTFQVYTVNFKHFHCMIIIRNKPTGGGFPSEDGALQWPQSGTGAAREESCIHTQIVDR